MPSKKHEAAMDYIYDRKEKSVKDLIGEGCLFHAGCSCDSCSEGAFLVKCQVPECGRGIDPHDDPVFVVGIYVDDEKQGEEFWCKECYVRSQKGVKLYA